MLNRLRTSKISTQLALAGFAVLVPLAVLAVFMDLSFRYDLNIVDTERAGIEYFHPLTDILYYAPQTRLDRIAGDVDAAMESEAMVTDALDRLRHIHAARMDVLMGSPTFVESDSLLVDPNAAAMAWERFRADGSDQAFEAFMDTIQGMVEPLSRCANLALDPAPDSAYLANALTWPMTSAGLLLAEAETAESRPMAGAEQAHLMRSLGALFLHGLLPRIEDTMRTALMEDPHFYEASPTLDRRLTPELDGFLRDAVLAFDLVEEGAPPAETLPALQTAREQWGELMHVGFEELDQLVRLRGESYGRWRMAAHVLGGASALLAALLLLGTGGGILRAVRSVAGYVNRVSLKDYDAGIDARNFPRELRSLAEDTGTMVRQLKTTIGEIDGILNAMTVPCIACDNSERLTYINRPYMDLFERRGKAEDYYGMTISQFFYGAEGHPTLTGEALRDNRPIRDREMSVPLSSGRRIHVRYDVAPLHDLDGTLMGAFALIIDITATHEQQAEISRLAAFPRENPNPVISVEPSGAPLYMNASAATFLEKNHLSLQDILPDNHIEIVRSLLVSGTARTNIEAQVDQTHFSWTYQPLPDQQLVHIYGNDVTLRKQAEEQLIHDAFHDTLTGLPNKALFLDRLGQAIRSAQRNEDRRFGVLILDLDGFKFINDTLGHSAGDKLLVEFAWRVGQLVRPEDTLARLGGDEFALLLEELEDYAPAMEIARRIQNLLSAPFVVDGNELFITVSAGIVVGPGEADTPEQFLGNADTAMYRAKAAGKARYEVFHQVMRQESEERLRLQTDLKKAVENEEFEPYYQPLIDSKTGRIMGFEALVRWIKPDGQVVAPGKFIPLAEETGLIRPIGQFMLAAACRQAKAWQDRFGLPELTMSINLSPQQMTAKGVVEDVAAIIEGAGVAPHTIKIEITESSIMDNVDAALAVLSGFMDIGVRLSIDDFGTGYSSLAHLHRFPFHYLKVDQSFVLRMEADLESKEIVRTIISLAKTLHKRLVAEGVETESQMRTLTALGCDLLQGYLFSRPVPAAEAEALLALGQRWDMDRGHPVHQAPTPKQ